MTEQNGQNGSAGGSIRRHVLTAVAVVVLLAGGLGGWATTTELSGAVIASGVLVVETNVKKVQHPTGGVVGELRGCVGDAAAPRSVMNSRRFI